MENEHTTPEGNILLFRPQSVWAMIGLTVITLSIYMPFWIRRQSKILNKHLPQLAISGWLITASIILSFLSIGWSVPEVLADDDPVVVSIGKALSNIDYILLIVLIFKVRNRLNVLLNISKGDKAWFSALWTFLFGIYYLQYKINRSYELETASEAVSSSESELV